MENRLILGFFDWLAAALCALAGAYLLTRGSGDIPGGGQSWFEALAHGIGIYFLGKAVYVARANHLAQRQLWRLDQLAELAALEHDQTGRRVVLREQPE